MSKQKTSNTALQAEIDNLRGRPSEAGSRTRDVSGRSTPSADPDLQRRLASLQSAHSAVQAELSASRDVLAAREREVDLMRMRVEEAEREVEILREDLAQAQQRISTLLEMGGSNGFDLGSEDGEGGEGGSEEDNSEEATMAFDKVSYSSRFQRSARSIKLIYGSSPMSSNSGREQDHRHIKENQKMIIRLSMGKVEMGRVHPRIKRQQERRIRM